MSVATDGDLPEGTPVPDGPAAGGTRLSEPLRQPARILHAAGRLLLRVPRLLGFVLPAAWAWAIWRLSSGRLPDTGVDIQGMAFLSNLFHAFEFGVLALLCLPLAPRRPDGWAHLPNAFLIGVLAFAVAWAFVDEAHQSFVPGRDASIWDLGTDLVGIVCTLRVARRAGPEAEARQLWVELLAGVVACSIAAAISTAWGFVVGPGWWPFL